MATEKRVAKPNEFPKWMYHPTKRERLVNSLSEELALLKEDHNWGFTQTVFVPEIRNAAHESEGLVEDRNLSDLKQSLFDAEAKLAGLTERYERLTDKGSAPADQKLMVEHEGLKRAHGALQTAFGELAAKHEALKSELEEVSAERDALVAAKEEALAEKLEQSLFSEPEPAVK